MKKLVKLLNSTPRALKGKLSNVIMFIENLRTLRNDDFNWF